MGNKFKNLIMDKTYCTLLLSPPFQQTQLVHRFWENITSNPLSFHQTLIDILAKHNFSPTIIYTRSVHNLKPMFKLPNIKSSDV